MKRTTRAKQRADARAKFPLPVDKLRALFAMLERDLPAAGCDHTLRLTTRWLAGLGVTPEPVLAWLKSHGGYCDCEVLMNVEDAVRDAVADLH